jgi:S1-C subfamily serine protease
MQRYKSRAWLSCSLALSLIGPGVPGVLRCQSPVSSPSAPAQGGALAEISAEEVFRRFASRIVFLTCDVSAEERKLASGVLVSDDGFVVTNAHVVEGCQSIRAAYISGASRRSFDATLKYSEKQTDTAVLKLPVRGLDHFDLGPAAKYREVRVGQRVYSIGNPRGYEQSISEGIVSGKREEDGVSWIQHTAPVSPGSSGGALISSQGELLGINSYLLENSQNLNFAVPVSTLADAFSRARDGIGGTYSGVLQNLTLRKSAGFKILITESGGVIQGCLVVMPPLLGSGEVRGTVLGLQFSFVVVGDSAETRFDGPSDGNTISGVYSAAVRGEDSKQKGTFTIRKVAPEVQSGITKAGKCLNDAMVNREAAEQGSALAQLNLGNLYYEGRGLEKDLTQAAEWIRKAALQGNAEAQASLGVLYQLGHGVGQDYYEAAAWYRKAAEQGLAQGQHLLGLLYETGEGVPQDNGQAATWFRKAADQGDAFAQNQLGGLYAEGKGVPKDHVQAAAWYRKAAEQGDATAQLNLGTVYLDGLGVPQNYSESYFWVKLAAAGRVSGASPEQLQTLVAYIASYLTSEALSEAQARVQSWLASHP